MIRFFILLVLLLCLYHISNRLIDVFEVKIVNGNELIGEKVILGNDTLYVIDYSPFNATYKLHNGADIEENYLRSLLNIKEE